MAWNNEINWTSAASISNAPSFVAVSDIYDAFLERYKAINSPAIAEPPMLNGTVETLDTALRTMITGGEIANTTPTANFADMGATSIGDYDNGVAMPPAWTVSSLETEIGSELPTINGPPGAWAWWWHSALNLCTVINRRLPFGIPGFFDDPIFYADQKVDARDTWAAAVTAFNAQSWTSGMSWPNALSHWARFRTSPTQYLIVRYRILITGGSANSVYYSPNELYTGNYTMAMYGPMVKGSFDEYSNNDYAVDENNFALFHSDLTPTQNIDGKYQSDINLADFDDSTVDEPQTIFFYHTGWTTSLASQRTLIDCGVAGGFDFV